MTRREPPNANHEVVTIRISLLLDGETWQDNVPAAHRTLQ